MTLNGTKFCNAGLDADLVDNEEMQKAVFEPIKGFARLSLWEGVSIHRMVQTFGMENRATIPYKKDEFLLHVVSHKPGDDGNRW